VKEALASVAAVLNALARLSQLREGIADFSVKRTGKSESIQGVKNSKRL
jgi:hypothetical protein